MLSLLSLSRGTESSGCRRIARATRSGRRLTRPCGRCLIDLFRICIRQAVHFIFSLLKKFRPGNGRRYAPRAAGAAPRLRLSPPLLFDSAVQRSTVIRAVLPSPWGPTKNQRARDVVVQRDTAPLSSTRASSAALLQAEASSRHGDGEKQRCISHEVTLPLLAAGTVESATQADRPQQVATPATATAAGARERETDGEITPDTPPITPWQPPYAS